LANFTCFESLMSVRTVQSNQRRLVTVHNTVQSSVLFSSPTLTVNFSHHSSGHRRNLPLDELIVAVKTSADIVMTILCPLVRPFICLLRHFRQNEMIKPICKIISYFVRRQQSEQLTDAHARRSHVNGWQCYYLNRNSSLPYVHSNLAPQPCIRLSFVIFVPILH
jgi:hypothetical protein